MRGDYAEALRLVQESKVLHPTYYGDLFLGWAAYGSGDHRVAQQCFHGVLKSVTAAQWTMVVLHALTGLAHSLAMMGEPDRALELLAFILAHSASHEEFKSRATRLQAKLAAQLPPDVVTAAQERGRAQDLWATAQAMLEELRLPPGVGHLALGEV
jgi:hypothetical protein